MSPHGPLLADKEGAKLARDIFLKYHGTDPRLVDEVEHDVMYQMGFSQAYTTVEGIKNAIEMVGAENVDTEAIYDGMEAVKFTLDEMVPPVEYSPERHYGVATQNLYKIVDGIMVQTDVLNCPTPDEVAEARE
ncbi:MAG: hypothetical protein SVM79_01290 [Chloroflexota bacterium]|nr:hypothetical protein [Chloroflexota bacterium]